MDNEILQSIIDYLADEQFENAYRLLDTMDDDDYEKAVEYLNDRGIFNIGESYKIYLIDTAIPILAEHQCYDKIARNIEALEEDYMDYDLMLLWSLAYTSMGNTERALEILDDYSDQGQDDAIYHTRLSMNYEELGRTEDAVDEIEDALRIDPECEDALLHGAMLYHNLNNKERSTELENTLKELNPELWKDYFEHIHSSEYYEYSDEEIQSIEKHIDCCFGLFESVLHEIVSPHMHIDLAIIPPNDDKDYYTIVTIGMGAFKMNVPDDNHSRIELVMYFPKDWNLNTTDEYYLWPIRELKTLTRFPLINETWLSVGHTITNGKPFSKYSDFNGFLIANIANIDPKAYECTLPNGEIVRFYQIVPLYEEELTYKIDNDSGKLLEKMLDSFPFIFDPQRPNTCIDNKAEKNWAIPRSCIVPVLEWNGAAGCFATDRIMVDGKPIGFMYREKPDNDNDSGWRFLSGDETEEYMNNTQNMGIYHLNTLCNYDKSIMPLLNSPYGTAFRRNENNIFMLDPTFKNNEND